MLKDVATGELVKTPEGNIYRVVLSPYYDGRLKAHCVKGQALYRTDGIHIPGRSTVLRLDRLEEAGNWEPETEGAVNIADLPRGTTVLYAAASGGKPQYTAGVFQEVLNWGRSKFCKIGLYQYENYYVVYAYVDSKTWKRVLS